MGKDVQGEKERRPRRGQRGRKKAEEFTVKGTEGGGTSPRALWIWEPICFPVPSSAGLCSCRHGRNIYCVPDSMRYTPRTRGGSHYHFL